MRHLIGILLAIALTAALFFGAGWGVRKTSGLAAHGMTMTSNTGLIALAALLGTGVFLGILMAVRAVSPLATGLPGLVLLGWTALLAVSAHRAVSWVPEQQLAFGAGFRVMLTSGLLALAGAAMVVPLFIPARWHGLLEEDEENEEAGLPTATGLLS
jgi:hypothetical protein